MSTVTEIDYDIDLSILVGPMEPIVCEHSNHHTNPILHDRGPATHYVQARHEDCGWTVMYAACARWVEMITLYRDEYLRCMGCKTQMPVSGITVLGPVNG